MPGFKLIIEAEDRALAVVEKLERALTRVSKLGTGPLGGGQFAQQFEEMGRRMTMKAREAGRKMRETIDKDWSTAIVNPRALRGLDAFIQEYKRKISDLSRAIRLPKEPRGSGLMGLSVGEMRAQLRELRGELPKFKALYDARVGHAKSYAADMSKAMAAGNAALKKLTIGDLGDFWHQRAQGMISRKGLLPILSPEQVSKDMQRIRALGNEIGAFGRFTTDVFRRMRFFVTTSLGAMFLFGPPLFIRAAIKHFLNFEKAVMQIVVRIPRGLRNLWGEFANTAFEISRRFGASVLDIAESLQATVGAGFKSIGAAGRISSAATRLAVASMSDVAQSTKAITNMLEGFGLKSDQAGRAADVLFAGIQQGTLNMHGLEQGMEKLTPIFRETGSSMEDMIATAALLSRSAQGEMTVFTELAQAVQRLVAPSRASAQSMQAMGVTLQRNKQGGIDWLNTITAMGERLRKLSGGDPQRMANLLGSIVPGGQGGRSQRALLRLFGESGDEIRAVRDAVNNAGGSVGRGLEDINVRAFRSWARLKATAERTFVSVGFAIVRALDPAVKAFEKFMKQFEVGQPGFEEFQAHVEIFVGSFLEGLAEIGQALVIIGNSLKEIAGLIVQIRGFKSFIPTGPSWKTLFLPYAPMLPGPDTIRGGVNKLFGGQVGGIVPGGYSATDNRVIKVRSGEEIITPEDPRHIKNIRGYALGGQPGIGPGTGTGKDAFKDWMKRMFWSDRGATARYSEAASATKTGPIDKLTKAIESLTRKMDDAMSERGQGYGIFGKLRKTGAEMQQRGAEKLEEIRKRGPAAPQLPQLIDPTGAAEAYRLMTPTQRRQVTNPPKVGNLPDILKNRRDEHEKAMDVRRLGQTGQGRSRPFQSIFWNPDKAGGAGFDTKTFDYRDIARDKAMQAQQRRDRVRQARRDALPKNDPGPRLPGFGPMKEIGKDEHGRPISTRDTEFVGPPMPGADFGKRLAPKGIKRMDLDIRSRAGVPPSGRIIGPDGKVYDAESSSRKMISEAAELMRTGDAYFPGRRNEGFDQRRAARVALRLGPQGIFPGVGITPGLMGRQPGTDGALGGGGRVKKLPWEEGYAVAPWDDYTPGRGPAAAGTRPYGPQASRRAARPPTALLPPKSARDWARESQRIMDDARAEDERRAREGAQARTGYREQGWQKEMAGKREELVGQHPELLNQVKAQVAYELAKELATGTGATLDMLIKELTRLTALQEAANKR